MKKKTIKLLGAALAMVSLAACSSDGGGTSEAGDKTAAQFVATIDGKTRAYETYWDNGDRIGVTGTSGAKAYTNVAYTTATGDGVFSTVTETEGIFFQNDDEVEFNAYYPWSASTTITADTHEQANQKSFDFIHATGKGRKDSPTVSLRFAHKMARIVITVVSGDDVTYDEVKAATLTLAGFKNNGSFDGLTGVATATGADSGAWQFAGNTTNTDYNAKLTLDDENGTANYSMILFPQELSAALAFTATNVQTYKASIDLTEANSNAGDATAKNELVEGRQYNLKVTISKTGIKVTSCNIAPWTTTDGGTSTAE